MLSNSETRSLSNPTPGSATPPRYPNTQKLGQDLKLLLIGALAIFISACGGGSGSEPVTLTSIAIDQLDFTLANGNTAALTATGTFSNGSTAPITGEVFWRSDNPEVAAVIGSAVSVGESMFATIASGVGAGETIFEATVSSVGVGETMIYAYKDGLESKPITVKVTAAELVSIKITPDTATIDTGATFQFTATGTYSDNTTGNISNLVTWSASTAEAASSGVTFDRNGLAFGTTAGIYTIRASMGDISDISNEATLTVTPRTLKEITITPSSAIIPLAKGKSIKLTATGIFSSGPNLDITTQVRWESADTSKVGVGDTGLVTGLFVTDSGGVTVTATMNNIFKSTTIVVTDAELVSIAITPTTPSIPHGKTTSFTAQGTYSDGVPYDISSQVTWSATPNGGSATPNGVTFNSSTATGNAKGTYSITAAMNNNTSNSPTLITSNTATLTVTPKVITAIDIAPAKPHVLVGATLPLIATATYSDGSTGDVTSSSIWSSISEETATIDANGIATGVAVGISTIFASKDSVDSLAKTLTVYLNSYTVGGTLSGLASGNTLTIANNGENHPTLSTNGAFTFSGILSDGKYPDGAAYSLSIVTLPTNQPCTLTYGAGNINGANVVANIVCGPQPAINSWSLTESLATGRYAHTATLLPNSKLLVTGGYGNGFLASAELYDPATGVWSPTTGSLGDARYAHTTTLLPNGKVLVTGGVGNSILASAELYNPVSGTWSPTGSLGAARFSHTATLLPNGKVLVAGGHNGNSFLASAELYDPADGSWSTTGSFAVGRYFHTATLLPNGKVLIAGGNNSISDKSAQLYNPATNSWSAAGSLFLARENHTATLLPDGRVLVAGGSSSGVALASAELYDPDANSWSAAGNLPGGARSTHTAMLLPTGQVLVAGGRGEGILATADLYDPTTTIWSTAASLSVARESHTATLLPDGRLLAVGGSGVDGSLASAYIYW